MEPHCTVPLESCKPTTASSGRRPPAPLCRSSAQGGPRARLGGRAAAWTRSVKSFAYIWPPAADREPVLEAVRPDGCALQHAAEMLHADRKLVLVAVRQGGTALHCAAGELQADHGVLRQAAASAIVPRQCPRRTASSATSSSCRPCGSMDAQRRIFRINLADQKALRRHARPRSARAGGRPRHSSLGHTGAGLHHQRRCREGRCSGDRGLQHGG
jgi:hypothetical protein